jgi:hypothetical protein
VNTVPFSEQESFIRGQLDRIRRVDGDQIIYGPDHKRGTVLVFGLDGQYRGMAWRARDQRASRKSLAKGYYSGLDEHGDPDKRMEKLLKLRVSTIKKRLYRTKDRQDKSHLTLARKLQLKIDKRSEKLLAAIDHLCGVLHRPPAQFELKTYLKMKDSTLSEGQCDTGFDWLPVRKPGPKLSSKPV